MVQHYLTIPYHILIKFAQWEKIKALPQPGEKLVYPTAIWHYAQGMAAAEEGKLDQAKENLNQLNTLRKDTSIENQLNWGINKVTQVCDIASKVLESKILRKEGKMEAAKALLLEAIAIEDQLNYNEPPDWFFSVRHILGNLYLETGDYPAAEMIYREDLGNWPKNGFALNGLAESLLAQGKTPDATQVQTQFQEAWKRGEMALKGSEIDPESRINVALRLDSNSSKELVYLATALCMN